MGSIVRFSSIIKTYRTSSSNEYDILIPYHLVKANTVENALMINTTSMEILAFLAVEEHSLNLDLAVHQLVWLKFLKLNKFFLILMID